MCTYPRRDNCALEVQLKYRYMVVREETTVAKAQTWQDLGDLASHEMTRYSHNLLLD